MITGGEGSWIWDEDGNRYLDFSSQLMNTNIGHQHPGLVAALHELLRLDLLEPADLVAVARGELAQPGGPVVGVVRGDRVVVGLVVGLAVGLLVAAKVVERGKASKNETPLV